MTDQAAMLRAMMAARAPTPIEAAGPPTIVIGSGKGGVGKSVISVLLAERLAREGRRVLLVDGSQNLGNLHVLLGLKRAGGLEDLLLDMCPARELLVRVIDDLWLLPSDSGAEALYAMGPLDRARLHHRLSVLYDDFDAVIVDSGAGLESVVRVATMRATRCVILTVPEPAALTDAYATIKIVHLQVADLPIDVLVNRAADEREGRASFDRLATAAEQFLHRQLQYLGSLQEDERVRRAVRTPGELARGLPPGPNHDVLTSVLERLSIPAAERMAG
ncbi:MAG TPA: P-loop NTPase [Gemmatimonadales bacterium]|nr:P-loop NTPase [Gemmatimonadales bacterium]